MNNKLQKLICQAIISQRIPEECLSWPIVELVRTTILRGGGEATSYHPHVLIRKDGKQVWKGTDQHFLDVGMQSIIPNELVPVAKLRKGMLYVLKPAA